MTPDSKLPAGRRKPPTLVDVAALAGVSAQTVSNYLTGRFKPRDANLQRLEEAIQALGYRPSAAARALRLKRSKIIAMLLEDGADMAEESVRAGWEPLHAVFLYGATRRARDLGFHIMAVPTRTGTAETEAARLIREGRVDGLICSAEMMPTPQIGRLQALAEAERVPIALLQEHRRHRSICSVVAEDEAGAALAAKHLSELGHRRVAVMTVLPHWPGPVRRRDAFVAAASRLGLDVTILEADRYAVDAVRHCAARAFAAPERPTALFAVNDVVAMAAMQQAVESGLHVPRDLSVVGFNDLDLATYLRPALTTVRTPAAAMGAQAVEALVEAIDGEPMRADIRLPVDFIVRDSTGRPQSLPVM